MMWVQFWDMNSGGDRKERWPHIYIECQGIEQAKAIFYHRFGHNPDRVSCTCCGEDYSVTENIDLGQLTGFQHNADWDQKLNRYVERPRMEKYPVLSVEEYEAQEDVLFIRFDELTPEDLAAGEPPTQGYVWQD